MLQIAGFWLIHQVSHLLRHHADRFPASAGESSGPVARRSKAQQCWNVAADCEINDDLVAGDAAVPTTAVRPSALGLSDSLTAEEYWDLLGGGEGPENGSARGGLDCDCGSGCDGAQRLWNAGNSGIGQTGQKLVERDVARRIKEHQRRRGNVPAGWQRWADEVLEPTVSWQRLLASAVRLGVADVAGRVDFSYCKPSRRSSVIQDVVLPSLRQPLPKVAMVLRHVGEHERHDALPESG
jgi:predicted metal-dependent peptidase